MVSILNAYVPFFVPIIIGYLLARFSSLNAVNVFPLVRFLFLPAVVFHSLSSSGRFNFTSFGYIALTGALMVIGGNLLMRGLKKVSKKDINIEGSFPNVAYFTIPFFMVVLNSKGLQTACSFLLGASIAQILVQPNKRYWEKVWREPWIIAAVIGIGVGLANVRIPYLDLVFKPMYAAAAPLMLLYLGAFLHPFKGLKIADLAASLSTRMIIGFAVALLAINLLPISGAMAKSLMLLAIAPAGMMVFGPRNQWNVVSDKVGILVVSILTTAILISGWQPWTIKIPGL
ncbi:MAG: AEC family transporter [Oligoflexales bacterium]